MNVYGGRSVHASPSHSISRDMRRVLFKGAKLKTALVEIRADGLL